MAEIVLCPLLQVVFDKLASQFLKTIALQCGYKEEIQRLQRMPVIQAVLEDAEEQQATNKALRVWLAELKEVAYDADDLLDEFGPEAMLHGNDTGFAEQVSSIIPSSLRPYAAYLRMFPKLKQIRERLDALAAERSNFKLKKRVGNIGHESGQRRETGSFVIESEVLGREDDKEEIVQLLLSTNKSRTNGDVSVIPIVGLGGIGKTTLAQLAYNDERVKRDFELKIWVSVGDVFDVKKIIESATKNRCDFSGMDVLQSELQGLLVRRRFLLVLDDVWNDDHDEWDKLRISLGGGAEGSKVLVTTRSEKVASVMGTTSPQYLKGLSDDDCWALFRQRAFAHDQEDHPNLLPIGKQIVKKCGGVPLAAKTLGSLMRFKREPREWISVQENDLWNVVEGENGILPVLRLSYSHLSSHLKGCFAYCSLFPKNYVIKKEKLIHLWIAQGLIPTCEGKSLEDIGSEYFNDLLWMFFFHGVKNSNSEITECKMHDLIHDLAQSVAGDEFAILEHGRIPSNLAKIRHLSLVCDFRLHTIPKTLYEAKNLRTLIILFPKGDMKEAPVNLLSSFRYLRVLDLSGSGIKKLHNSISYMISLRYLDLSNTLVEKLPETIGRLGNLQVLNLSGCSDLMELPDNIGNLLKLRHLIIDGCERLTQFPTFLGNFEHLQTLPKFIVGSGGNSSLWLLTSLRLKGELNVIQLENASVYQAAKVNFKKNGNLHSLGLSWGNDLEGLHLNTENDCDSRKGEKVLEYLQPHQNLKSLSIKGYPGISFPRWVGCCQLSYLTKIVFINCRRCEHLPTLGQLPFLQIIHMHGMDAVKNIGSEFYGDSRERLFPSLKELTLIAFPHLEFWWSINGREEFPSLVKLTINKCSRLINMPWFPSLQLLELRNCNEKILRSAANQSSLSSLVIDVFDRQLECLESLLQNSSGLKTLTISSCPNLYSISSKLGGLITLKSLTIRWCEALLSLPQELQNLSSLESLEIVECHSLIALPEEMRGLSSLRSLSVENCSNISSLPMGLQCLTALEHLAVMYCPNLVSLPADLSHLAVLRSVHILSCPKLASLPEGLQHVTTLQNLHIHSCPSLTDLSGRIENLASLRSLAISDCQNIMSVPEGLLHLTTLQHLSIRECPVLEKRCKKYIGEDWPKIAHIPHAYIGSAELRKQSSASSSSH